MKKRFFVLSMCFLMAALTACSSPVTGKDTSEKYTGKKFNDTFYNPIRIEQGLGDPWMYKHTDGYYYFTYSEGVLLSTTRSKQMTQIIPKPEDPSVTKLIGKQKPLNVSQIWAPEIFFFNGLWYVYFTAVPATYTGSDIDAGRRAFAIKSKTEDAMGEWEDEATEIDLPVDYRAIDATFMNYLDKQYIIWSGWPTIDGKINGELIEKDFYKLETGDVTLSFIQYIYITELEHNNPAKAKSLDPSARVTISKPIYKWEQIMAIQNEGPAVTFAPDGTPVCLYTGSFSGEDYYSIGYSVLTGDPMETAVDANGMSTAWKKAAEPLMATDHDYAEILAPGHCSVTKSPDGTEDWIIYHAAKFSGAGWDRMARLQKLTWDGSTPKVEKIDRFSDEVKLPSGEKVNRRKFEAEDATLSKNCVITRSVGTTDDGKEFNYASGGKNVNLQDADDSVKFLVNVPENGEYLLSVRYSNTSVDAKSMSVTINGEKYTLYAPFTPGGDLYSLTTKFTDLFISPDGPNQIVIHCDAGIVIDCLIVDYLGR